MYLPFELRNKYIVSQYSYYCVNSQLKRFKLRVDEYNMIYGWFNYEWFKHDQTCISKMCIFNLQDKFCSDTRLIHDNTDRSHHT